ncbi:MAG: hypothetical protein ACJ8CB_14410 [Ktedonobacteraceae bacterium]
MQQALTKRGVQPLEQVPAQQDEEMRLDTPHPWWHQSLIGSLLSLPLVRLALLVASLERHLLPYFSSLEVPFMLAVLVIALLRGAGPALLAVLLDRICLQVCILLSYSSGQCPFRLHHQ